MKKLISILASGLVLGAVSCVKQEMAESQGEGVLCVDMSVVGQTKALS